jgi:hypothetical protein
LAVVKYTNLSTECIKTCIGVGDLPQALQLISCNLRGFRFCGKSDSSPKVRKLSDCEDKYSPLVRMSVGGHLYKPFKTYKNPNPMYDTIMWWTMLEEERREIRKGNRSQLELQSALVSETGHDSALVTQENVQFVDEATGLKVGFNESYDGISASDQTQNTSLTAFLNRPVRIASFIWNEADPVGTTHTYAPWHLYFNDTRIKKKVDNFAFIQCKLKVKVLINASPFYFGAMIGAYTPNPGLTPDTVINDAGTRWFIPTSQKPHMWIYPQGSKGDEMTLPFFYHKNWLNIQSASDLTNMGTLKFINYTDLAQANGVVGTGVSVQIYAWAEDVKLSGPSVGLAMQSDEYGNGVVSAPATAIANSARWFENVPIIGRFATATRIGASAVSSIAALFGFTNVPNIKDCDAVRSAPFPQLASTAIGYPTEKLTIDSKNELSVDPSILGLPTTDEMVISHLAQKESYLCTALWTGVNAVDDILFSARVGPSMFDNDGLANAKVYQTPMCWISQLFKNWRGDIIFRFKFVATPYHKGRVRITYDPSGTAATNIINIPDNQMSNMTQIVDLGEESDVEIRIPYQQATSFMQARTDLTAAAIGWSTSLAPPFSYSDVFDNGMITVRVQTLLTAPVAATTLPIMVFVRAAEDIEFANPCALGNNYSMFTPQSDEVYGLPMELVAGKQSTVHDERYLVNFGESIKSLRLLLRRQTLSVVNTFPNVGTYYSLPVIRFGKFPIHYGFDPSGIHSAVGLVAPGPWPFNFAKMTPYNWIAPAFCGQRGSMQWSLNWTTPNTFEKQSLRVIRDNQNSGAAGISVISGAKAVQSDTPRFMLVNSLAGASGQSLTNQRTQTGLSVQLPMQTRFRFESTQPLKATTPSAVDGSDIDFYRLEGWSLSSASPQNDTVWMHSGIGTDFGLHFFVNVPTFYLYSATPAAA